MASEFGLAGYGLALAAGGLSTLSPCVLPLLPIVVAAASDVHRRGPLALAAGLTLSFATRGLSTAVLGASFGLDSRAVRLTGAALLIAFGALLLLRPLQRGFELATAGLASAAGSLLPRIQGDTLGGQFALGSLLGIVWSPCAGPTLGAAIVLAEQRQDLPHVALVMLLYGLGASVPLLVLGSVSRQAMARLRARLVNAGERGRAVLGTVLVLLGLAILTGAEERIEAWTLDHAPQWLVNIGTQL